MSIPGLCTRHLANGGLRVQSTTSVRGVEMCEPCATTERKTAEQAEGADASLEGRRFHKHARNCTWCLPVISAEQGTPEASADGLCEDGKRLFVEAVMASREGRPS